jgi:hypothetical protein
MPPGDPPPPTPRLPGLQGAPPTGSRVSPFQGPATVESLGGSPVHPLEEARGVGQACHRHHPQGPIRRKDLRSRGTLRGIRVDFDHPGPKKLRSPGRPTERLGGLFEIRDSLGGGGTETGRPLHGRAVPRPRRGVRPFVPRPPRTFHPSRPWILSSSQGCQWRPGNF